MSNKDKILRLWNEIKKRYETYPVKDEADFDTVLNDWVEVLGEYDEDELQYALKMHIRETKSSSYPKIAHIEKYLEFKKIKDEVNKPPSETQIWYDKHIMHRIDNGLPFEYIKNTYINALNELIKIKDLSFDTFSLNLNYAYKNGLLDDYEEYVYKYADEKCINKLIKLEYSGDVRNLTKNIFKKV